MDKRINLGIVGFGIIVETRIYPAILATNLFKITSVFDQSPERRAYLSEKLDLPVVDALDKVWQKNCEAIYIATPNQYHVDPAIEALKQGLGVMIEKPLASNYQDARRLLDFAEGKDIPLLIAYMSKFNKNNQLAQELVTEGKIGELRTFTATFSWFNSDMSLWRLFREHSGPGALSDIGIYSITTGVDFFGDMPLSCTALGYPAGDPVFGDKCISGKIDFSHNRWMQIDVSLLSNTCGYTLIGTQGAIYVGSTWYQSGKGEVVLCRRNNVEKFVQEEINPYEAELACFHNCLNGKPVPQFLGIRRGVEDIKIIEALDRSSAQGGRPVAIE